MRSIALAIVVATACVSTMVALQREPLVPHTKKSGRATVEYRYEGFHVAANYDYSQKNHRGPWLLIDVAMSSERRFVIHRDNFSLIAPDGRTIPLATQQALIADSSSVTSLAQNSKTQRQNLDAYFSQRGSREGLAFYSFPGVRSVSNESIVDNDRVTGGPLLFKSPEGRWPAGTYRLTITNERAQAGLPITLE
jgi:hypothetical protein